jgi:hypothetical protein
MNGSKSSCPAKLSRPGYCLDDVSTRPWASSLTSSQDGPVALSSTGVDAVYDGQFLLAERAHRGSETLNIPEI